MQFPGSLSPGITIFGTPTPARIRAIVRRQSNISFSFDAGAAARMTTTAPRPSYRAITSIRN